MNRSFFLATPTGFEARLGVARRTLTDEDRRVNADGDVGLGGAELRAAVSKCLQSISRAISARDTSTALAEVAAALLLLDPDDQCEAEDPKLRAVK